MRNYNSDGERSFPHLEIQITLISTDKGLNELSRLEKDLRSTLPEDLGLALTEISSQEIRVKKGLTKRTVKVTLSAF